MEQTHISGDPLGPNPGVLLVGNFLSRTRPGSFTVCELLAARLAGEGWKTVTTSDKSARLQLFCDMMYTVWNRRHSYSVAQIDVYSGPSFVWAESVCWLLQRLGKPFILTLHGGRLPGFAKRWPGRVRRLLRSANIVTTPSHEFQELFSSYCSEVMLLPNAIDLTVYPFRSRSAPKPKLVWLRALHSIYNPCMAPRAVAQLVAEFPDIQLTMFGPDKRDGSALQLSEEIARLGLTKHVSLPGGVPKAEVPGALNSGDLFLNTTDCESFGVSVMEAAACGMCIVTTNVGELGRLWQDEHDALLVPPQDDRAMAGAIRRILSDPALASNLSRNARAKAELFGWDRILPRWQTMLRKTSMEGKRKGFR